MMTKLIAFCGTHGTGKTSTIRELASRNTKLIFEDMFKVSRECQKKLGYEKLSEAYETINRMKEFQELILEEKRKSDYLILKYANKPFAITERSYLDIAAYTKEWVTRLYHNSTAFELRNLLVWYDNYYKKCIELMSIYSNLIFVYPLQNFDFEIDKNRADLKSRDNIHNFIMNELIDGYISTKIQQQKILHLKSNTLENRVKICENFINNIYISEEFKNVH